MRAVERRRRAKLDATAAIAAATVAGVLGSNAWLLRTGRRPHSQFLRDNARPVVVFVAYLGLHVWGPPWFHRYDLFKRAARALTPT